MKKFFAFLAMIMVMVASTFAASTDPLCFTAEEAGIQVGIDCNKDVYSGLEYSTDGINWSGYAFNTKITLAHVGDKVFFRRVGVPAHFEGSTYTYRTFTSTGKVAASGNIMSLIDATCQTKEVAYSEFYKFFKGCKGLTTAPELPATSVTSYSYSEMFSGCTSLTKAPELPATTPWDYSYESMFSGCTSLTEAPELPATTLKEGCYKSMFSGCTGLTQAPELPAMTLLRYCYESMFQGCTSLTKAPELPALTLAYFSYRNMFSGCSSLNEVTIAGNAASSYADGMLSGVANTGTIRLTSNVASTNIPSGWVVERAMKNEQALCFTAEEAGIRVGFFVYGNMSSLPALVCSTDGENWQTYQLGTMMTLRNVGDKVYFAAKSTNVRFSLSSSIYIGFNSTGKVAASGNIMTLLDWSGSARTASVNAFYKLFANCEGLTTAPELPASVASDACYEYMFQGCSSLTAAPELPATVFGMNCYQGMFQDCTSLTKAPELPATTLQNSCYNEMFQGCTSLTTAPELPATELMGYCYASMFQGCTSLTTAPYLPAKSLSNYCYKNMFAGCTSLKEISIGGSLPVSSSSSYTKDMLKDVASSGTITCTSLDASCPLPNGWNVKYVGTKNEQALCFTAEQDDIQVGFAIIGTLSSNPPLVYSTDSETWLTYKFGEKITLQHKGDKVYFMNRQTRNNGFSSSKDNYINFFATGKVAASGNVMTLISWDCSKSFIHHDFYKLFADCTGLTTAPELPATTLENYCYAGMFQGCTGLTKAPELPATKLSSNCYEYMFQGCTGLTQAPELPATTLSNNCYYGMFLGCTSLTTAPELPATTLADYCYSYMFNGCTGLTTAPSLHAMTLARTCYSYMFYGCIRLVTAPALRATKMEPYCYQGMFKRCTRLFYPSILPATTLAANCYESMYEGCTTLTNAPKLNATTLASGCYRAMFKDCANLTTAPDLPASTTAAGCYREMFENCASLNKVSANFLVWYGNNTSDWLSGVASTGTFTCPALLPIRNGYSYIPDGWTVDQEEADWLCFKAEQDNVKVAFKKIGTAAINARLYYKLNDDEWAKYTLGTEITLANEGDKVLFTAENKNADFSISASTYINFTSTGKVAASGNVMSLLDANCEQASVPDYAFYCLFKGCNYLTKAPRMTATTMGKECYQSMYEGCSSLEVAPELGATELAENCYADMFKRCTSLTSAPLLLASTMATGCYSGMFQGCTSLTDAPDLDARELAANCYASMFKGCSALDVAPYLPAETLKPYCYQSMFEGCTNIGRSPALHAEILAHDCCASMFKGCTGLTQAQVIYATTAGSNSCQSMFEGCENLVNVPALRATTLWPYCYASMFKDCKKLTTAPALPATKLADHCYQSMFDGCSKLNYVNAGFGDFLGAVSPTTNWLNGVSATGDFVCVDELEITNVGASTVPNGWSISKSVTLASPGDCLRFTAEDETVDICFTIHGAFAYTPLMLYSTDGYHWLGYPYGKTITLCEGDNAYFRAVEKNKAFSEGIYTYIQFSSTGKVAASGNIMYLLDSTGEQTSVPENAFRRLFYNCEGLTSAPELPATTLAGSCYSSMFYGTGISVAPALPATVLGAACYENMFNDCKALTATPELPATTPTESCYSYMFAGCTALTQATTLPATTMQLLCYANMFEGCESLTEAPALPATTLALGCYYSMFNGCSTIKTAPELPATTLANNCYQAMFKGCTSLTSVPALHATSLASGCYAEMFSNCEKVNSIVVDFTEWDASDGGMTAATADWLAGVAETGFFNCPQNLLVIDFGATTVPEGWTIRRDFVMPENCLAFTAEQEGGTDIAFNIKGKLDATPYIYYSTDGQRWETYNYGTTISLENKGDKAYFMAMAKNETFSKDQYVNYIYFTSTAKVSASGSIMSLLDFTSKQTSVPDMAFSHLFYNCANLISAPELPATTLGAYCYDNMFRGTGLTVAPELPAEVLEEGCYQRMLSDCKSLTTAPELKSMVLALSCYSYMFSGCTSLTEAPELPAVTLRYFCYENMFSGCTGLTTAPELPATMLPNGCYQSMFEDCTNLNSVRVNFSEWQYDAIVGTYDWLKNVAATGEFCCPPALDLSQRGASTVPEGWAITINMKLPDDCLYFAAEEAGANVGFKTYGSSTTRPELLYSLDGKTWREYALGSNVTLEEQGSKVYFMAKDKNETFSKTPRSYIYFFASAKVAAGGSVMSLLDNTCEQTSVPSYAFTALFIDCANLTTAPKLPATTLALYCYNGMFRGCTGLTTAPELPATTLAPYCYFAMFQNCTNLTTAPVLPATTLESNSYNSMFINCSKLNSVTVYFKDWNAANNATYNWLSGVASTGTFYAPTALDKTQRGVNYIPTGWNVEKAPATTTIYNLTKEIETILNGGESTLMKLEDIKDAIFEE